MKIYFDQYVRNALYDKGGYYFDTTFEILKPMYKLFNLPNKT